MNYARLICQLEGLDYPVKEWAFRLESADQSVVWNGESLVGAINGVTVEFDDSTGNGLRRIQVVVTGPTAVLRTCDISMWWMATAGKDARYVWLYPVGGDRGSAWVFPEWITPSSTAIPIPEGRLPDDAPSGAVHANQLAVTYANGGSLTAGNFNFYGADFDPYREKVTRRLKPIDYGLSEISGLETFHPTRSRPLFHSKHGDPTTMWISLLIALLTYLMSPKGTDSQKRQALVRAGLAGGAAYAATEYTDWGRDISNRFDGAIGVKPGGSTDSDKVVNTGQKPTTGSGLGSIGNWVTPAIAAVGTGAVASSIPQWVIWAGLGLGAYLILKD